VEKYRKYIGFALLLIGVIFGVEGIITAFSGLWVSGMASQALANVSQEAMYFEGVLGIEGFLQTLQAIFTIVAIYGVAKTLIGIFCIMLGIKMAFKKKTKN